ncbi:MAG: hypothetical protein AAF688_03150 [Bacteroidota bacterium]
MKNRGIIYLWLSLLLLATSCDENQNNDPNFVEREAAVTEAIIPNEAIIGETVTLTLKLSLNGCDEFSRFEREKNGNVINFLVYASRDINSSEACLTAFFEHIVDVDVVFSEAGVFQLVFENTLDNESLQYQIEILQ